MLQTMAEILKPALEAALLIAFTLSLLVRKAGNEEPKATSETKVTVKGQGAWGVWAALLGASVIGYLTVYRYNFFGSREVFEGWLGGLASLAGLIYLGWVWSRGRCLSRSLRGIFLLAILLPLITIKACEVLVVPTKIFFMTTAMINSELILKLTGLVLGVIIAVVFGLVFTRALKNLSVTQHKIMATAYLGVVLVRQIITLIQLLLVLGIMPVSPWIVSLVAPIINTYYPAFFYVLLIFGCLALILAYLKTPKADKMSFDGFNPAQKRKLLSGIIKDRRWVRGASAALAGIFILLAANYAYAQREVKLSPPTPLQPKGQVLKIPITEVNDGNLHRFSYVSKNNVTMRFIVIKKSEKAYGIGLDACTICGVVGYYQRGKNIICKNCDVEINIPTIGFPGGCNPIPLTFKIEGKNLLVKTADLEAQEKVFK